MGGAWGGGGDEGGDDWVGRRAVWLFAVGSGCVMDHVALME